MNIETIIDKLGIEQLSEMQKEVADAILHSNKDAMRLFLPMEQQEAERLWLICCP